MTIARKSPTFIKSVEKAGAFITGALLLFRVFFGMALDSYLLIGITLFAIFYLWFGFFIFTNAIPLDILDRRKRAEFTPFVITSSIFMGAVYSLGTISILYAIYFYPQMQLMLWFAFLLLLLSGAAMYLYNRLNPEKQVFCRQYFYRSAAYGVIILLLLVIPVETRLNVLYRKHPDFIESYMEYRKNPDVPENLQRLREERSRFR